MGFDVGSWTEASGWLPDPTTLAVSAGAVVGTLAVPVLILFAAASRGGLRVALGIAAGVAGAAGGWSLSTLPHAMSEAARSSGDAIEAALLYLGISGGSVVAVWVISRQLPRWLGGLVLLPAVAASVSSAAAVAHEALVQFQEWAVPFGGVGVVLVGVAVGLFFHTPRSRTPA